MSKLVPVLVMVLLCVLPAGCASSEGGPVVVWRPGEPDVRVAAPEAGAYGLFDSYDLTPKDVVQVAAGAPLGFRTEGGRPLALAGERTIPLEGEDARLYWQPLHTELPGTR